MRTSANMLGSSSPFERRATCYCARCYWATPLSMPLLGAVLYCLPVAWPGRRHHCSSFADGGTREEYERLTNGRSPITSSFVPAVSSWRMSRVELRVSSFPQDSLFCSER